MLVSGENNNSYELYVVSLSFEDWKIFEFEYCHCVLSTEIKMKEEKPVYKWFLFIPK